MLTQQLRALDALPKDLVQFLALTEQHSAVYDSSSWESNALFWPLWEKSMLMVHIHAAGRTFIKRETETETERATERQRVGGREGGRETMRKIPI